jgi:hypothetical protein
MGTPNQPKTEVSEVNSKGILLLARKVTLLIPPSQQCLLKRGASIEKAKHKKHQGTV